MSSVVRKSSHFVPKLKRNQLRKKVPLTPPTTQTENALASSQAEEDAVPATPVTQTEEVPPLLNYSIPHDGTVSPKKKPELDMDVDPKDATNISEHVIHEEDSDNEYGDNDIFRQPAGFANRRKSSVAGIRRLSGIAAFRRSGSISATPTTEGEETQSTPVRIGIPVAKPTRKRRASSVVRASKRLSRGSIILVPPAVVQEQEEGRPDIQTNSRKDQPPSALPDSDIIVGIDPQTGRFAKFRASEDVVGHADLPVAPSGLVTTLTDVRQLPRKIAKEDEKYFAMVDVLTDDLTMAELCKPTIQIGSTSDKFEMAEQAKEKISLKRDDRRRARKYAREQRISYEAALRELQGDKYEEDAKKVSILNMPEAEEAKSSSNAVQVAIVEGKIQVNPESTVVTRETVPGAGDRQVEIENPFEHPITSNSYTKLAHTDAWTKDELIQLYKALSTWGTDFTFIAQLFPYRTRRQVKRKFILEEKRFPELVELALKRRLPPDFEEYRAAASASSTFKSLEDFHREIDDLKREHERHLEEINSERERAIKEDLEASRKREIEIRTGAKSMTRAEKVKELRRNETVVGTIEDVKKSREELERSASLA